MLDRKRCALVLVDYQAQLMPVIHGADEVIRQAVFLAQVGHALGVPVLGTEQNPEGLGPNDDRIRSVCEQTLAKTHFNACRDGLADILRANEIEEVVVAGCEAHVCLMQTALGLREEGLRVVVVPGACGSRRPKDKALAMQRLFQGGVTLASAEMIAFEWLGTSSDPQFREVLEIVKSLPA